METSKKIPLLDSYRAGVLFALNLGEGKRYLMDEIRHEDFTEVQH